MNKTDPAKMRAPPRIATDKAASRCIVRFPLNEPGGASKRRPAEKNAASSRQTRCRKATEPARLSRAQKSQLTAAFGRQPTEHVGCPNAELWRCDIVPALECRGVLPWCWPWPSKAAGSKASLLPADG